MRKLDNGEFLKLLQDSENSNPIISDSEIILTEDISIDVTKKSFEFKNCIFKGSRIDFYDFENTKNYKDKHHTLSFNNCEIENDLFIKNCYLYQLIFNNVKISSKRFFITSSEIENISIIGSPESYNLISNLLISDLLGEKTNFDFRLNELNDVLNISDSAFDYVMINKNIFKSIHFNSVNFNGEVQLWKNTFSSYSSIRRCKFNFFDAKNNNFGKELILENCDFLDSCNFENAQNENVTSLKIEKCNFNKYVYFDNANIYSLLIESSFFKEIISFQDATFNKIKFNRTHFEKIAFFSNINIISKTDLDLNTVRTIKAQLLKTENKIDYLEFKKHEFELYRKSLKKDKTGSKIILWLNRVTSDYNTNWTIGVVFTLGYGLIFYIVLYLLVFGLRDIEIVVQENRFWVGYFKYLIIPNFNSPFGDENLLNKWYQYLFFTIGKIAITYGLYETVQSFRKYGK